MGMAEAAAAMGRDRRQGDDRAAIAHHVHCAPTEIEDSIEVDGDSPAPLFVGHRADGVIGVDPRRGNEEVDRAEGSVVADMAASALSGLPAS